MAWPYGGSTTGRARRAATFCRSRDTVSASIARRRPADHGSSYGRRTDAVRSCDVTPVSPFHRSCRLQVEPVEDVSLDLREFTDRHVECLEQPEYQMTSAMTVREYVDAPSWGGARRCSLVPDWRDALPSDPRLGGVEEVLEE